MSVSPVWVQNLIGFINGHFPADERWKAVFVEQLQAPAVPDGWKLVPIEPTPEMLDAGRLKSPCATYRDIYKAMVRSAPSPMGTSRFSPSPHPAP